MLRKSKPGGTLTERVAGWSVRHRFLAVLGWLALVVFAALSSALIPGDEARSTDPGGSGRAQQALRAQQANEPIRESVLVQSRASDASPLLDDPAARVTTEDLVTALRSSGAVADLRSPLAADGAARLSADGKSGLVTFQVAGNDDRRLANYETAVDAIEGVATRHPDMRVAQAGDRSLSSAVDQAVQEDFQRSEFVSLPLTAVVLLLVFGSLVAAGIPLLLAATTVAGTFGLLQTIGHWMPINSAASSMVLLIGVAVGIDYSLFYIRRVREERAAGRDITEALQITARTSGHAVVVSGLTVMLCVFGLLLTGLDNLQGLAVGAILVVGLAMTGSVTVLPALLALLGRRIDSGRILWLGRRRAAAAQSRVWSAVAHAVVRRPLLWGGVASAALIVMALPAVGMRLQDAAVTDSLPRSVPAVDAAIRMQQAFPGAATPSRVVIWRPDGRDVDGPEVRQQIEEMRRQVATPVAVVKVDRAMVVRVPLPGGGTDATSNAALKTLRDDVLPATLGKVDGIEYAVTGRTAFAHDFTEVVQARSPLVYVFVLMMAFILLMVAFRSAAIPTISILLNLLSIGAAYGVVTWVFQDGHLSSMLGFTAYGGVVGWQPLFMFVILFGLSMDYHIFILSRIRERWAAGATAHDAIVGGISTSAGVVSSAAVIMIGVFSVFIVLDAIEYKMLGVGMAVAVLIDATVVRGVLLPAALAHLGSGAWTLPGRPSRDPIPNPTSSAAGIPMPKPASVT